MPIHNLSGFLPSISLFGMMVPVYYVVIAIAFIVSMIWLVKRADRAGLSRNRALDTALVLMISGFIGSRLFHVFYEEPGYYRARPWLIFDIWSGGFVWYGGALISIAAVVIFLRWKRESIGTWLDLFAPVCALGYAIGRMACVLTGCCYGRVTQLPSMFGGELIRHPSQSYAVIAELGTLTLLLYLERRKFLRPPGQLFLCWLCLHSLGRILMESFRDDPRGPMPLGISVSTWISLVLFTGAFAAAVFRRKKS